MEIKRKHKTLLIGLFLVMISFVISTQKGWAESGSFTYEVIHPENQLTKAGYFDLRMTPGQKQTVQIKLTNPSPDSPVTVDIKRNMVKTNSNGVLEYGPTTIKKDPSAKIDFNEVVTVPESITLAGGEVKNLDVAVQMPEASFDGVLAGGIQLQVKESEEDIKARADKSGVSTRYAYLVAMVLSESDAPIQPEVTFNRIYPGLSNYRNAIFVNFSNAEMTFLSDMTVDFNVTKKGSDIILYETKKTDMKMAPTSMIDFPVLLNGELMEVGTYTGHVVVTSGDQTWSWTEDFDITKEDADKFNKQDVSIVQESGINWSVILLITGVILGVLLLVFVFLYFYRRKMKRRKKKGKKKK